MFWFYIENHNGAEVEIVALTYHLALDRVGWKSSNVKSMSQIPCTSLLLKKKDSPYTSVKPGVTTYAGYCGAV